MPCQQMKVRQEKASGVPLPLKPVLLSLLLAFGVRETASKEAFSDQVGDILSSIQSTVGYLTDFVGERNGCKFQCPNGSKPKSNPAHRRSSNGCGAFGIKIDPSIGLKEVTKCCNIHDECYDTCNQDKEKCDNEFKHCLEKICKKIKPIMSDDIYKGCKSTADVMFAGTVALGCKPYKDAQKKACLCKDSGRRTDL